MKDRHLNNKGRLRACRDPRSFIDEAVAAISEQIGAERATCGLSGGVDSSVAAVLVHRAIGANLTCIFVDNGLLRKGEAEEVESVFGDHYHMNLVVVDARERFLEKLQGVADPEEKRKIIGTEFIRVFEEESKKVGRVPYLVQGTLMSDVIESVSSEKPGVKVKSHHNVGGLPEDLAFELVEPLRTLYKDDVRLIGRELGLPDTIVNRQPFPGPGLAVRIIGEVTRERLSALREADAIVREEIAKLPEARELWQYFAVLPAIRSTGVSDGGRTYSYPIAIRAVKSGDGMDADWARLPYETLEEISRRIVDEVPGINRVVYDITPKPPATIEWE